MQYSELVIFLPAVVDAPNRARWLPGFHHSSQTAQILASEAWCLELENGGAWWRIGLAMTEVIWYYFSGVLVSVGHPGGKEMGASH